MIDGQEPPPLKEVKHPGKIILQELFNHKKIGKKVAGEIGVHETTLYLLLRGTSNLSTEMAIKLSKRFKKYTAKELLNFQIDFDLAKAKHKEIQRNRPLPKSEEGEVQLPGPIIQKEVVERYDLNVSKVARKIDVDKGILSFFLKGYSTLTLEMAYRLGKEFAKYDYDAKKLLTLQNAWDLVQFEKTLDPNHISHSPAFKRRFKY